MIKLIELPYKEIKGFMCTETVEFHHGKHLNTYVNNLNNLLKGTDLENLSLDELINNFNKVPEEIKQGVINNGGGVINHNIFFNQFSNNQKTAPEGLLLDKINETFGSLDNLKKELIDAGVKQFGSGWSFLVVDNGNLKVISTKNQDNPKMLSNLDVLIALDVWEHSYYLDYRNVRAKYLEDAMNFIDWKVIEERFNNL